ncbi:NAD(P)H-hydrate epimerase [Undibacterium danionis]|uniref:Bifunctional NAD(P)H-hydrate repair enzyme n=1 Tax=Undibacterium danionis TaxID=1812100 RepID=A0ABV6IBS7_9BURK
MQYHALYQIAQIRDIEKQAKASLAIGNPTARLPDSLMITAGKAAAQLAWRILDAASKKDVKKIMILAGPGDNGGDAFEVAHQLAEMAQLSPEDTHYEIHVLICGEPNAYSNDAKKSLLAAQTNSIHWHTIDPLQQAQLQRDKLPQLNFSQFDLIVDGLFGIGLSRPITGIVAELIIQINHSKACPVLALDVPSGLNADTGQVIATIATTAEDAVAVIASHTISFIANKPGLHTASGKDYAGIVVVDDLNIDNGYYPVPYAYLSNPSQLSTLIPARKQNSHKGSYGDVLIVGGSTGMQGAAILAGRAALYTGAGRVYLDLIEPSSSVDYSHPEIMHSSIEEHDLSNAHVVIGPGLGHSPNALNRLRHALIHAPALVIDADALNLIAIHTDLQALCRNRSNLSWRTIITPHPLEAARLLNCDTGKIQADRCLAAQTLANQFRCTVILKGSGSIIAAEIMGNSAEANKALAKTDNHPNDGESRSTQPRSDKTQICINPSGNPALATAGTGDVLAGICGTMLGQGLSAFNAACLATYIHGLAADDCVRENFGPIGMNASELIPAVRKVLNQMIQ